MGHLRDNSECLTLVAQQGLTLKSKLKNREIGIERTSYSDKPNSTELSPVP